MIKYTLQCDNAHSFEGWFASSDGYDKQRRRGLVLCPDCGSKKVSKALMAPRIGTRQNRKADVMSEPVGEPGSAVPDQAALPPQMAAQLNEKQRALLVMMREVRKEVEKNSDYVGPKFAEEARKIHYDEAPARGIYGEVTPAEAHSLAEEGIEAYPLPMLPEDKN